MLSSNSKMNLIVLLHWILINKLVVRKSMYPMHLQNVLNNRNQLPRIRIKVQRRNLPLLQTIRIKLKRRIQVCLEWCSLISHFSVYFQEINRLRRIRSTLVNCLKMSKNQIWKSSFRNRLKSNYSRQRPHRKVFELLLPSSLFLTKIPLLLPLNSVHRWNWKILHWKSLIKANEDHETSRWNCLLFYLQGFEDMMWMVLFPSCVCVCVCALLFPKINNHYRKINRRFLRIFRDHLWRNCLFCSCFVFLRFVVLSCRFNTLVNLVLNDEKKTL